MKKRKSAINIEVAWESKRSVGSCYEAKKTIYT
jgi:hypothetical protein